MNKLSKLTALLLALLLAIGAPMAAVAETITTEKQYEEHVSAILAQLYDTLMQTTTYEEVLEATKTMTRTEIVNFLDRLLADKVVTDNFVAYDEYLWQLYEEYLFNAKDAPEVVYTNAAPLVDFNSAVMEATVLTAQERAADSGITLTKKAEMNKDGTSGTITLEAYAVGSSITTSSSSGLDIILILDMSNSMDSTNNLGGDGKLAKYTYNKVDSVTPYDEITYNSTTNTTNPQYYVKQDGTYLKVLPCSTCKGYTYGCLHQSSLESNTRTGTIYTPDTTQFYTRSATGDSIERREALMSAVQQFVSDIINTSAAKNIDSRVAFVRYNGDSRTYAIKGDATTTANSGAWISATTDEGKELLWDTVGTEATATYKKLALWTTGQGTRPDTGTARAVSIMESTYGESPSADALAARKRVVIMFTDGEPSDKSQAGTAIGYAKTLKDTYKSTVYSVGIVDGADGSIPFNNYSTSTNSNYFINQFLHFYSSNFPSATGYTPWTAPSYPASGSYYLSADDEESLKNIFSSISTQIDNDLDPGTTLDETSAVTVDVLSDYFKLPNGITASSVNVYTTTCTGATYTDENGNIVYDAEGNVAVSDVVFDENRENWATLADAVTLSGDDTISVSKFSYTDEWCGPVIENNTRTGWHGKKLIIEIPFEVRPGFLGGNGVPTNTDAGVYSVDATTGEKVLVQGVVSPVVNIPIKGLTVTAEDKHIYLSNILSTGDMIAGAVVRDAYGAVIELKPYEKNYGLAEWQFKYVDVAVTTSLADQPFLSDTENMFRITCTVTPTTEGNANNGTVATEQSSYDDANVYVYKPTITFKDTKHKYLNTDVTLRDTNYYLSTAYNYVGIEWLHGTAVADPNTMNGVVPRVEYDFAPATTAWLEAITDSANYKVIGTQCQFVNIEGITLISDNQHKSITTNADGTVSTTTTTVTSKYYEGSGSVWYNDGTVNTNTTLSTSTTANVNITTKRQRLACSNSTCNITNDDVVTTNVHDGGTYEFVIHIFDVLGDLIVTKSGMLTGESALFTVTITAPDGQSSKSYNIVLTGVDSDGSAVSVRLADLLVNSTVSVTEDPEWSWRYELTTSEPTCTNDWKIVAQVNSDTTPTTVTITNDRDNDQWLSDEYVVHNNFSENGNYGSQD